MFTEGLQWHRLLRSNVRNEHHLFAGIYGDLVFHLHSASYHPSVRGQVSGPGKRLLGRLILAAKKGVLLQRFRNLVRQCLPAQLQRAAESGQGALARFHLAETIEVYDAIRQQLFQDPERYFSYLRTGRRS